MDKKRIIQMIDEKSETYIDLSTKLWGLAETRFEETKSAELFEQILRDEEFNVETGIAGIPTAFVGSYGNGEPVISVLAEYDALSGLSQKAGMCKRDPVEDGGNGHGCGHHLLGAGSLAAAVTIKDIMKEKNLEGTIRLYGCPGEEGGSGKAYMARAGVFEDVDIALCWHPFAQNAVWSVSSLANYQVYYKFHGKSSHAAASPHLGRSALDAVELMNVGVNYLREHVVPEARFHYAVTNSGGISPNVVQPEAEVLYLIRAPKIAQVQEIYERICEVAKGAALMTQTTCEVVFDKACSNLVLNNTLEELLRDNFKIVGPTAFDNDDIVYANRIRESLQPSDIAAEMNMVQMFSKRAGKEIVQTMKEETLSNIVLPYEHFTGILPGSTDVGDVSWNVPTAQILASCFALGTPAHSWQMVDQGISNYAHNGMLTAGKVLAMTALDALMNPSIIETAKNELKEKLDGEIYVSPIPNDVMPKVSR